MPFPKQVKLVEVGPRDGLQNEPNPVPTDVKITLIEKLAQAGCPVIEASSFVSPERIPQLADNAAVLAGLKEHSSTTYSVLVPNLQGFHDALTAGAKHMAVFISASEQFSQNNTHCSIDESLSRCTEVLDAAKKANIPVRAYISCVMGCPYEGDVAIDKVATLAEQLTNMGCYEISLGDTIGVGNPLQAQALVEAVGKKIGIEAIAAHFHDTYGQALVNLYAVMEKGVQVIDASVAGLGGCPYAPGASGNVATEDVVYLLDHMGIKTGIDAVALHEAGQYICKQLNRSPSSKACLAG